MIQDLTVRMSSEGAGRVTTDLNSVGKASQQAAASTATIGQAAQNAAGGMKNAAAAAGSTTSAMAAMAQQLGWAADASGRLRDAKGRFVSAAQQAAAAAGNLAGATAGMASAANAASTATESAAGSSRNWGESLKSVYSTAKNVVDKVLEFGSAIGQIVQEGAQLGSLNQAFSLMGGSAQQMDQLRQATAGLVSDKSLMETANFASLMGLELNDTIQLLARAPGAALAMGTDSAKAAQDIITAVSRKSVEIIDNLGIKVRSLDVIYQEFANKSGIAVSQMTAKQKDQAFMQEVLAKSTKQLALTESARTNEVGKAAASFENMTNNLKIMVSEQVVASGIMDVFGEAVGAIGPLMEGIAPLIRGSFEIVGDVLKAAAPAISNMMRWFGELAPIIVSVGQTIANLLAPAFKLLVALGPLVEVPIKIVMVALQTLQPLIDNLVVPAVNLLANAVTEVLSPLKLMSEALSAVSQGLIGFNESAALSHQSVGVVIAKQKEFEEAARKSVEATQAMADKNQKLDESNKAAAQSTEELTKNILKMTAANEEEAKRAGLQIKTVTSLGKAIASAGGEAQAFEIAAPIAEQLNQVTALIDAAGGSSTEAMEKILTLAKRTETDTDARAKLVRQIVSETTGAIEEAGAIQQSVVKQTVAGLETGLMSETDALERAIGDASNIYGKSREEVRAILNLRVKDMQDFLTEGRALMQADLENILAAPEPEKKKGGGKRDDSGARELIWQAKLLGMTEVQREIAEIGKEYEKNLKTAGRNIEAIAAADAIMRTKVLNVEIQQMGVFADSASRSLLRLANSITANHDAFAGLGDQFAGFGEMLSAGMKTAGEEFVTLNENLSSVSWQLDAALYAIGEGIPTAFMLASTAMEETLPAWQSFWQTAREETDATTASSLEAITAVEQSISAAGAALAAGGTGLSAALAAGKALAGATIKDTKKLAWFLGGFEVAEAAKAAAELNFFGAAAHGLAAAKYFMVAGSGGGAGAKVDTATAEKQRRETAGSMVAKGPASQRGPQIINQNFFSSLDKRPAGQIVADALNETGRKRRGVKLDSGLVADDAYQGGY